MIFFFQPSVFLFEIFNILSHILVAVLSKVYNLLIFIQRSLIFLNKDNATISINKQKRENKTYVEKSL